MTEIHIEGLGRVSHGEFVEFLIEEIGQKTWFLRDFKINGIYIVGSRIQKKHREDSDLDVVLMYEGSVSDCTLHDILNAEPSFYDDVQIDFISTYGSEFESSERPYIQCIMEEERKHGSV